MSDPDARLLGASHIRERAEQLGIRPTKQWGQNFVIDANTVRRIVRTAELEASDVVLEVGPGLGSLTLALLPEVAAVTAVEIDPTLARALPDTVAAFAPDLAEHLRVVQADALRLTQVPGPLPTALVANLPYNVSVPVILHLLATFPTLTTVLVMVQREVAERLAAAPGSKIYGVPSVKAAWYADVTLAGHVGRSVFWPAPRVDSALVRMVRRQPPTSGATRAETFAAVDAAFAQRRKTIRAALSGWSGTSALAEADIRAAGLDPSSRGENLDVEDFARLAAARSTRLADEEPGDNN